MASGSVVLAWVALERFSARKSTVGLRPPSSSPSGRSELVSRSEALHAGPSLDQRPVDAEMITRKEPTDAGLRQDRGKEPRGNVAVEQPVAVLGEGRVIPDRLVDTQA